MSVIQTCRDTKDCLDLFRPQGLSLKPVSRLNISVQLPQLKKSGAKISNWEVMERSKEMARPHSFPVFKVAKSSLEFVRFEAEIENYGGMESVLAKLDMKTIKLSGFQEPLKVRAAEAKPQFPTRSEWDSFFRNNRTMNEMKPGERPDTIHVRNLPTQWFLNHQDRSGAAKDRPSEFVVKKVFGTFGDVRAIDIPMLDPYRQKMKSSISGMIQTFSFEQDLVFDAYVQYKEYVGFVKAMNSLKGMKLMYKDRYEDRCWVANIKVDYDKTKHLAESSIRKRSQEREKIADEEREREDARRRKRDLEELKNAEELRKFEHEERARDAKTDAERRDKVRRRTEREERRRAGKMLRRTRTEDEAMAEKIAVEERKLVIAHRKLEAIRLLDELLERVKVVKSKGKKNRRLSKEEEEVLPPLRTYKDLDEKLLRDRLVKRLKQKEVSKMEACGERLRNARDGGDAAATSMEDISEDEFENGNVAVDRTFLADEEELRLTSTEEEEEEDITEKKKKKKRSKDKKTKKGKKEKKKKKDDDDSAKKKHRRRGLAAEIDRAKKISDRERRSASREGRRRPPDVDKGYPDYRQRRREQRQREKLERLSCDKRREQAKEEMYDRMMHPHLYADDDVVGRQSESMDRLRRPRRGEHYEQVQLEYLERELRERQKRRSPDHHHHSSSRHPHHHHHHHLSIQRSRHPHYSRESGRYDHEDGGRRRSPR